MFRLEGGRPGDARGFLHKSFIGKAIGGVAKRFIPGVGLASDVVKFGFNVIQKRPARPVAPRTTTARPTLAGQQGKELGRDLKFGGNGDLSLPVLKPRGIIGPPPSRGGGSPCRENETARCCRLRNGTTSEQAQWQAECGTAGRPQVDPTGVGEAVLGRYGAALEPGIMIVERSVCLAGMQLGDDGLCYNKGAITNSQRQWPRGRRPLLTGGDMRAIGIAARAGAKLERTTKRLRGLGMMKALPKGRGARPHAHAKPIAAVSV